MTMACQWGAKLECMSSAPAGSQNRGFLGKVFESVTGQATLSCGGIFLTGAAAVTEVSHLALATKTGFQPGSNIGSCSAVRYSNSTTCPDNSAINPSPKKALAKVQEIQKPQKTRKLNRHVSFVINKMDRLSVPNKKSKSTGSNKLSRRSSLPEKSKGNFLSRQNSYHSAMFSALPTSSFSDLEDSSLFTDSESSSGSTFLNEEELVEMK